MIMEVHFWVSLPTTTNTYIKKKRNAAMVTANETHKTMGLIKTVQ